MQTITLQPDQRLLGIIDDLLTIETKGIYEHYNPKYFTVVQKTIESDTPKIKIPSDIRAKDGELKSLGIFRNLSTKLKTLFNQVEKGFSITDEDEVILSQRRIKKSRDIIHKYLETLNKDNNFKISRDKDNFVLNYYGQFIQAKSISPYSEGVV